MSVGPGAGEVGARVCMKTPRWSAWSVCAHCGSRRRLPSAPGLAVFSCCAPRIPFRLFLSGLSSQRAGLPSDSARLHSAPKLPQERRRLEERGGGEDGARLEGPDPFIFFVSFFLLVASFLVERKGISALPVDEVPRGVRAHRSSRVFSRSGARRRDLGVVFLFNLPPFPPPPAGANRCWVCCKMGTPTTLCQGLILCLLLTCQLSSVSSLFWLLILCRIESLKPPQSIPIWEFLPSLFRQTNPALFDVCSVHAGLCGCTAAPMQVGWSLQCTLHACAPQMRLEAEWQTRSSC